MKRLHPRFDEIYLFANPNGEGYILAELPIAELLELYDNG